MNNLYVPIIFLLFVIVFSSCKQTNEPDENNKAKDIITETGNESPIDFIGTVDLNDWDSDVYKHFTIKDKYWIDKSTIDTTKILGINYNDNVKIHNLSKELLPVKISVTPPFRCSEDTLNLFPHETKKIYLSIDTTNLNQDNFVLGKLKINLFSNPPIQYILRWDRPKSSGGLEIPKPQKDILYPAYPNPSNGIITFRFDIKAKKHVIFKVLDNSQKTVAVLINDDLIRGGYEYNWLTTQQERDNLPSGIYKVVLETDGYYSSGDILFQK